MVVDSRDIELKKSRMAGIVLLIVMPIMYLIVAMVISRAPDTGGHSDLMFYMLLIVAMSSPAMALLIQRIQVQSYRKRPSSRMTPEQLYFVVSIMKMAFAEVVFLYGLVVYLVAGGMDRMLIFYPIGLAWAAIFWPTRNRFETFITEAKRA